MAVERNKHKKGNLEVYKRPITKLDKYIDLILKNITNIDEFIYLQRFSGDPYNLTVVNYNKIKEENVANYYTISKKGLCQYINGKPSEFIGLAFWMKEREMYYLYNLHIYN